MTVEQIFAGERYLPPVFLIVVVEYKVGMFSEADIDAGVVRYEPAAAVKDSSKKVTGMVAVFCAKLYIPVKNIKLNSEIDLLRIALTN